MSRHQHKRPWFALIALPRGLKKASRGRRVIATRTFGGREYYLHATKGYRAMRD
jgi:hypothetical protein